MHNNFWKCWLHFCDWEESKNKYAAFSEVGVLLFYKETIFWELIILNIVYYIKLN